MACNNCCEEFSKLGTDEFKGFNLQMVCTRCHYVLQYYGKKFDKSFDRATIEAMMGLTLN